MKRLMIFLFTLLTVGEWAVAQKISVADVEAVPGETVNFSLNLSEGKADTYTAFQFDVQFPATGFTTTGGYTITSIWSGATCVVGDVDGSGLATVPVSSAEKIPDSSVENLVSISFKVDESVAVGEYDVTLKNMMFEYNIKDKDIVDDVTFKVNVVSSHTIILDENSTIAPPIETNAKVRVLRTIKAGIWSTICLPFSMSEMQVKAAFGDDVELGDFKGANTEKDAEDNVVGITVNFDDAMAIEANHPYIIKVSSAVSEFTIDGVDISPEADPSVDKDKKTVKVGKNTYTSYNSFVGTYVANTDVPEKCLFLSDNKFWYSTGATKIKGYRAYFDFYDVLTEIDEAGAPVFISFGDDMSMGISENNRKAVANGRYYNLHGVEVEYPQKGLYVKDGKKVIIK